MRIESPALVGREQPLSVVFVVWRSYVVGTRRESLHGVTHAVRLWNRAELLFPSALSSGVFLSVAGELVLVGRRSRKGSQCCEQYCGNDNEATHQVSWHSRAELYRGCRRKPESAVMETTALIPSIHGAATAVIEYDRLPGERFPRSGGARWRADCDCIRPVPRPRRPLG